mmetsp:Transcript_29944/g.41462  ORF Transcript_29944/g.41462 Transcript_29944/m.41462 type:complete len:226 (-) Transcript_29944:219-896(-)|eukprot:CAMPEP_0196583518 /NCGR_PEP_ID=MMETSP1081-20130531/43881_1 /TAXON_ID=36882 /ORGANISM="Pyramimonas amylifera, Strain CCMP720" /LENGTH=225 /DNA_ID=CAMNT_0041904437 /DNA_START=378 /DNA_END=1055 /DNA_ORIENTATION=-
MVSRVTRFADVFRKSNASFPGLKGMVIEGRVESVGKKMVGVNTGYKGHTKFVRAELEIPGERLEIGSTRRLLIEGLSNPIGEMELSMSRLQEEERISSVWAEFQSAFEQQQPIMGRVLNSVNRGYSVGVAGHVAYLPTSKAQVHQLKPGKLQPFVVLGVNFKERNLVVSHPALAHASRSAAFPQHFVPKSSSGGWADFLQRAAPEASLQNGIDKSPLDKPKSDEK